MLSAALPHCYYTATISRYIGFADNENSYDIGIGYRYRLLVSVIGIGYWYQLSASANKKVNIDSLTNDIRMYYLYSWFSSNIILSKLKYDEKIYLIFHCHTSILNW